MSQAFYETEGTAYLLSAPCMLGNGTYSLSILVVLTGSKRPFIEDHLAWHAEAQSQRLIHLEPKTIPEAEAVLSEDEELQSFWNSKNE
ncbi:putative uncharacterized protein PQLC2L [Arapaima gigas]